MIRHFLLAPLALFLVILVPGIARAQNPCMEIHEIATDVMTIRQNGIPMIDFMAQIDRAYDPVELRPTNNLVKEMAINAYQITRYDHPEDIDYVIAEFANVWVGICFTAQ